MKFFIKIKDTHKIIKRILLPLVFFVMKTKKHIQFMYQNNALKKNMLIYY